ncbi:hypothetical protein KY359_00565 [Candidatus Woesearchaeota archaeon]|nr:hypothetical protein [Candidatus Woesearchaeota archaeon]
MRPLLLRLLERTELILALSIALPLLLSVDVSRLKIIIEIGLGIVMYFSLKPFMGHKFSFRNGTWEFAKPILINYALLSGAYVLLAYLFFGPGHDFFTGYVLIAIAPPAVSIIPFCFISKCDAETADIPVFISFLASLVIIPATLFLMFGKTIDFTVLMRVMAIVIIIPMFLAYKTCMSRSGLFDYSKAIINICLAAIIFVSISLNRAVFFDITNTDVIFVYIISLLVVFCLGVLTYSLTRKVSADDAVTYSFYATQKNVGTSITLGIFLFHPDTAVPAIIALAMQFIYFIFFEEVFVKRKR